jgi:hypothetical protein
MAGVAEDARACSSTYTGYRPVDVGVKSSELTESVAVARTVATALQFELSDTAACVPVVANPVPADVPGRATTSCAEVTKPGRVASMLMGIVTGFPTDVAKTGTPPSAPSEPVSPRSTAGSPHPGPSAARPVEMSVGAVALVV